MRIAIMVSSILVASLMSAFAQASCVIEPLQPELKAADIVYVGTVVRSELVPSVDSLRDIKRPRDHLVEIKHTVVPRIVLKGNPEKALAVLSTWQYNDPRTSKWSLKISGSGLIPSRPPVGKARNALPFAGFSELRAPSASDVLFNSHPTENYCGSRW